MKKFNFRLLWPSLKFAFGGFSTDKITKLSASLAYYTIFSLGPLLIIIIYLCSIFLGREAVEGSVYGHIRSFIGADAAKQIQDIIKNASISGKGGIAATIGIITLLIGATSVFSEIQDSVNGIWGLKAKPKAGFMKLVKDRLLSFGFITSLGFLLLVSLGVTALIEGLGSQLRHAFPDVTVVVFYIINLILTLVVTTLLFGAIFKVLPDATIKWKDIWPGAIATSLLFLIGKFAISFYISKSNVGSTYGAAGSLVVLLLWIYYSSIILYFGAEFTKGYVLQKGARIVPAPYAVWNNEPTVAGAETKNEVPAANEISKGHDVKKNPAAHLHHQPTLSKAHKKPAGMGTVLLGLVIYFVSRSPAVSETRSDR